MDYLTLFHSWEGHGEAEHIILEGHSEEGS